MTFDKKGIVETNHKYFNNIIYYFLIENITYLL